MTRPLTAITPAEITSDPHGGSGPVQLRLYAMLYLDCDPATGAVTKVRVIPDQGSPLPWSDGGHGDDAVERAVAWVDANEWIPPADAVWDD